MANVVITSTTNSIKVDFGVYNTALNLEKGTWSKDKVLNFQLLKGDASVLARIQDEPQWGLVYSASGENLVVDTIDGVAPSSNDDLYTKLIALIA